MNRFPALAMWATVALACLFGGMWLMLPGRLAATPPRIALPSYGQVPDFALVMQDGQALTRQDLAGRIWVADFVFSRCAGQCPMMHEAMQRLQDALRDVPEARLISFSVDPSYDTPERLALLARQVGATPGRWDFVTGSQETIWTLAQEGFKLGVAEGEDPREPIGHSTKLALVDGQGMIRGYIDAGEQDAVAKASEQVGRLLAGRGG